MKMIESFKNTSAYISLKKHSVSEIEGLEKKLNYKFPPLYKAFLQEIGSGYFSIEYNCTLPNGASLQTFYSLNTIQKLTEDYSMNEIPKNYIPFGADNSGSLFCFRNNNETIYYLDNSFHTVDEISKDFESLLQLIKP